MDDRSRRIGLRIQAHRRRKRMTQEDLARAIGVTRQQAGRLETGSRTLKPQSLEKIARALGIPLSQLEGETDPIAWISEVLDLWGFHVAPCTPDSSAPESYHPQLQATLNVGPIALDMVVDHRAWVSAQDLQAMRDWLDRNGSPKGVITSDADPSQDRELIALAQSLCIPLIRRDLLLARLVNLDAWCHDLIERFDARSVPFVEPRLLVLGQEEPVALSLWLERWLANDELSHACFLGQPGVGKSTVCHWLAAHLARRHLENPGESPIPLLVHLWDYPSMKDLKELLFQDLLLRFGTLVMGRQAIERLLVEGRFVIILDGLDEMDLQAKDLNLRVCLRAIAPLMASGSRVLLTTRTGTFHAPSDILEALIPAGFWGDEIPEVEMATIQPFDAEMIREYLSKESPRANHRMVEQLSNFDLWELARLPLALKFLTPYLLRLGPNSERIHTLQNLLMDTVRDWARQEASRAFISAEELILHVENLAWSIWKSGSYTLPVRELPPRLQALLDEGAQLHNNLFLQADDRGRLRFTHRTIFEFLVTKRVFRWVRKGSTVWLRHLWFDHRLAQMASIWLGDDQVLSTLLGWLHSNPEPAVRNVAAFLLGFSRPRIAAVSLRRAFSEDPDLGVRAATAWALVRLGQVDVIREIGAQARAEHVSIERSFARMTLLLLRGESWEKEEKPIEEALGSAILEWSEEQAHDELLCTLVDPSQPEDLRCIAARLAGTIGGQEIREALTIALPESTGRFRRALRTALDALPPSPEPVLSEPLL